jgi:hypothetical protein
MRKIARAVCPWLLFGFIMWLGIGAIFHPENGNARAILGLMVLGVAIGAATLLDRLWKD